MNTLTNTSYNFPNQTSVYKGKVREVYRLEDDKVVMIATDRLSAFDVVMPKGIPYKGQILNQIATKMMKATEDLVPNWMEASPDPNVAIGQLCTPFKVEMVIRGYMAGHAAREYKAGKRELCGVKLPEGLKENDKFERPIITPSTKADMGDHDEDISREKILEKGIVSEEDYKVLEDYTYKLFEHIPSAIIQKDLSPLDIKDIEGYYQIKKQFRQDYDWISICLDIKYEKDELDSSFEEIGSKKDFKPEEVEMYYDLIKQVDICLENDWKSPKGYPLIEDQKQIWMDTAKRASKTKDPAAKLAIWKTCRLISINSKNLDGRAYDFVKNFQKRNNLKEIVDAWAIRYHIKPAKEKIVKDSSDPLDEVAEPSQYNLSIIDKLPIKRNVHEMIKEFHEDLKYKKDDNAALKSSEDVLMKINNLSSKTFPEKYRLRIIKNLRDTSKKIEKIISKLGK